MVILIAMKRSRMMVNSEATDLRKMKLLRFKKKGIMKNGWRREHI